MPIMSSHRPDYSSNRYKRFAAIVFSYADEQDTKPANDQIPVEGLFRLMEMYRYNAFRDETHAGVLALRSASTSTRHHRMSKNWHLSIKDALDKTIDSVFEGKKDEAVYKIEHILFLMTQKQKLTAMQQTDAKNFFSLFGETLARSNNAALAV